MDNNEVKHFPMADIGREMLRRGWGVQETNITRAIKKANAGEAMLASIADTLLKIEDHLCASSMPAHEKIRQRMHSASKSLGCERDLLEKFCDNREKAALRALLGEIRGTITKRHPSTGGETLQDIIPVASKRFSRIGRVRQKRLNSLLEKVKDAVKKEYSGFGDQGGEDG